MQPDWHGRSLEQRILHEQDDLLVVDKPWGIPSTGRSLADDDCLQFHLMARHGGPVWAAHQLDADTSGVNLFTTRRSMVAVLQRAMRWPSGTKTYWTVLHGHLAAAATVDAPLGRRIDRPDTLGVVADGKTSWTRLSPLAHTTSHTLVSAEIRTGRTHQIRIHAAHLGHPLVGEEWYLQPRCTVHPRQALHAARVQLDALALRFEAPWPEDLRALCADLELPSPDSTC